MTMRKVILPILTLMFMFSNASAQRPAWEQPLNFGWNALKAHATMYAFPTDSLALSGERAASPWFQSLDGTWSFRWVANPKEMPTGFFRPDFDVAQWDQIPVPSNWELHGHGRAIYLNWDFPFEPAIPPVIPHDDSVDPHRSNPVGLYRRSFSIPESWSGQRITLHFGGVSSAFYVYVNGVKVGYSQGSRLPAEFEITEYVQTGENTLAVEVYRWSDGSFLENQDHWRLSGIHREVYLQARPEVYLEDAFIHTDLDEDYRDATLRIEPTFFFRTPEQIRDWTLEAELYDGDTPVPGAKGHFELNEIIAFYAKTRYKSFLIQSMHQIDTLAIQTTQYFVRPDGTVEILVDLDVGPTAPELPRVGMETLLDETFTQTQYYGRGPGESYWDRKLGMKIGRYEQPIRDWPVPYIRPQANGNRTDLRWLRIDPEADMPSLRISALEGEWLSMGISPYHRSDLEEIDHWQALPVQNYPQLQIDHRIMGVGGWWQRFYHLKRPVGLDGLLCLQGR